MRNVFKTSVSICKGNINDNAQQCWNVNYTIEKAFFNLNTPWPRFLVLNRIEYLRYSNTKAIYHKQSPLWSNNIVPLLHDKV